MLILFFVILLIIGIIVAFWVVFKNDIFDLSERVGYGIISFLLVVLSAFVLTFITQAIVESRVSYEYKKVSETKIIALQDNGTVESSFFLGSGFIEGSMSYVYMIEKDGQIQINTIDAGQVSLAYSNEPKIEEYKAYFSNGTARWLFGEMFTKDDWYKIYVPEGTVKQNFNVDLQ